MMYRTLLAAVVTLCAASLALAVPSLVEPVGDGVLVVRDDAGVWGGMTNGITHMNKGDYTARKVLDLSAVPADQWAAVTTVRLSAYFMVRDYSWHDLATANGLDEKYQFVVNGTVHEFATSGGAPVYSERGAPTIAWYDIPLPKGELVRGPNEILIRKSPDPKGDDYLYLGIDNSEQRGNSSVAFDGKTWTQEKLTIPGGNGEYMVRLYLLTKPAQFEARWQPGRADASVDPTRLIVYAGARGARPTAAGLPLAAGQAARVEWEASGLDRLEPFTATVAASGTVKTEWLDMSGAVAKDQAAGAGGALSLPAGRGFAPAGLLVTASGGPVVLQGVTLAGSRAYHPVTPPVNLSPLVKPPAKGAAPQKPSCTVTAKEITLATGQLRAKFSRGDHLRLTSLYNLVTRCEMVRDPARVPLLLVEVGEKRYTGSADFTLGKLTPTKTGFSCLLTLAEPALTATLTAAAAPEGLRLGLKLANSGTAPVDFKLAFPYLASLAVSPEAKDDYYYFPWGGGIIAPTPAVLRRGYGDHEALYQLLDLYSPALGGGVSLRAEDTEGWHKIVSLRKHLAGGTDLEQQTLYMRVKPEYRFKDPLAPIPGTSLAFEYLRRTRAPGASFSPATVVLCAHAGDWHQALADYAAWAHRAWKFRPYPSALKGIRNMMAAGWGTGILFKDGQYRTDIVTPRTDCVELMSWWDWSPLGPFGTPFDQLDKVLSPAQIKEWSGYFVTDPVTGKRMWNNQPGDYDGYNPQFGGLPAFQEAIRTYRKLGALVTLYTDPFRMDFASKIGLAHGKEWGVINEQDKLSTEYEVYNPCHDLPAVRDWVAQTMARVMRETGADGIRLDEYGHRGWACYNPAHQHTYAEPGITQWQKAVAETTRRVHEEMDRVKPGSVLTTEHPGYDYLMQYLDGCITYDLTVQKSPLRPLEVNTQRFYFPECKAYELDHQGADLLSHKKFWNAVESFGRYYPDDMYALLNENEDVYQGRDAFPLLPTLQPYLYCNRFRGAGKTMYHVYNAQGHTFEGLALGLPGLKPWEHVVELLSCTELPVVKGCVSLYLERDGVACVAVLPRLLVVTREAGTLQVTLKAAGKGDTLALVDAAGRQLVTMDARTGARGLDTTALPADAKPVAVKLLRGGQLVDVAALPVQ